MSDHSHYLPEVGSLWNHVSYGTSARVLNCQSNGMDAHLIDLQLISRDGEEFSEDDMDWDYCHVSPEVFYEEYVKRPKDHNLIST